MEERDIRPIEIEVCGVKIVIGIDVTDIKAEYKKWIEYHAEQAEKD